MKKTITLFAIIIMLVAVIYGVIDAMANQPTVTRSTIRNDNLSGLAHEYHVLNYSFTTDAAETDTAFIYAYGGGPIEVSQYGWSDSLFSVEVKTDEATADSAGLAYVVQVTSATTPVELDWNTVYTSTAFDSTISAMDVFRLRRLTASTKMRILAYESSALTGGNPDDFDPAQTWTLRLTMPKQ